MPRLTPCSHTTGRPNFTTLDGAAAAASIMFSTYFNHFTWYLCLSGHFSKKDFCSFSLGLLATELSSKNTSCAAQSTFQHAWDSLSTIHTGSRLCTFCIHQQQPVEYIRNKAPTRLRVSEFFFYLNSRLLADFLSHLGKWAKFIKFKAEYEYFWTLKATK